MNSNEPEEPAVFRTDITMVGVRERARLVETPVGRLALVFDRPREASRPLESQVGPDGPTEPNRPLNPEAPGVSGSIVAIDAWCPHLDGPLWEGSAIGGEIACPWHRWRYSLRTGQCTWAPAGDAEEAAETEIRVFPTREGPGGRLEILLGTETRAKEVPEEGFE